MRASESDTWGRWERANRTLGSLRWHLPFKDKESQSDMDLRSTQKPNGCRTSWLQLLPLPPFMRFLLCVYSWIQESPNVCRSNTWVTYRSRVRVTAKYREFRPEDPWLNFPLNVWKLELYTQSFCRRVRYYKTPLHEGYQYGCIPRLYDCCTLCILS